MEETTYKPQYPVILSVSRATDIPAFYSDWFFNRLEAGYCLWKNPYNNVYSRINFDKVKFIVFWSKNPELIIPYLERLKEKNINFYFQYTLNAYENQKFEPGLPLLIHRIETFRKLSRIIGKERIIWRFDPLILTDTLTVDELLKKVYDVAMKLYGYTDKLVFSFVDIKNYTKVGKNMTASGINYVDWTEEKMKEFAKKLSSFNKKMFKFRLATCAEKVDLSEYGIEHNRCIDSELILKLSGKDEELVKYLEYEIKPIETNLFDESPIPENAIQLSDTEYAIQLKRNKDSGQRLLCGCCVSKDIGCYNTCPHRCVYCYANASPESAEMNYRNVVLHKDAESLC